MDWLLRNPEWVRASTERLGQGAGQARKDLAFGLARQIGAGPARRQEKLRYACVALVRHVCEST